MRNDRLIREFSSLRTTAVMILIYILAIASATFIEKYAGSSAARRLIYTSGWFMLLNLLLVLNFILLSIRLHLLKGHHFGVLMLHWGFIVVLIGAATTHFFGEKGSVLVFEGEEVSHFYVIDENGMNEIKQLPFSIALDDFTIDYYPGSSSPSSFRSDITIARKGEKKSYSLEMNKKVNVGSYRLYQTSFTPDEKGSIMTVNNDLPGTLISYSGYAIIVVGMLLYVFNRKSRFRALIKRFKTLSLYSFVLIIMIMSPWQRVNGAEIEIFKKRIDKDTLKVFSEQLVLNQNGRVEPMNTYSLEILRKIHHSSLYRGISSDEVLYSMITSPEKWFTVPIIYVGNDKLAEELGGKYLAICDLFSSDKSLLATKVKEIYSKSESERGKYEKEIIKVDERGNILHALLKGEITPRFVTGTQSDLAKIKMEIFYNKSQIFKSSGICAVVSGVIILILLLISILRPSVCNKLYSSFIKILSFSIFAIFLWLSFGLGVRWYIAGHFMGGNSFESMIIVGWGAMLAGLLFSKKSPVALCVASLVSGTMIMMAHLSQIDPQITPLVPILNSAWLLFHVGTIAVSYGFFGVSALLGGMTLIMCAVLKPAHYYNKIEKLAIINELTMIIGFFFLIVGIFLGAVWANQSWGRYWGWDPKETWALITMLSYLFVIHSRRIKGLNGRYAFAVLSILAFFTVIMTFFGVNVLFSGMHSYGG